MISLIIIWQRLRRNVIKVCTHNNNKLKWLQLRTPYLMLASMQIRFEIKMFVCFQYQLALPTVCAITLPNVEYAIQQLKLYFITHIISCIFAHYIGHRSSNREGVVHMGARGGRQNNTYVEGTLARPSCGNDHHEQVAEEVQGAANRVR